MRTPGTPVCAPSSLPASAWRLERSPGISLASSPPIPSDLLPPSPRVLRRSRAILASNPSGFHAHQERSHSRRPRDTSRLLSTPLFAPVLGASQGPLFQGRFLQEALQTSHFAQVLTRETRVQDTLFSPRDSAQWRWRAPGPPPGACSHCPAAGPHQCAEPGRATEPHLGPAWRGLQLAVAGLGPGVSRSGSKWVSSSRGFLPLSSLHWLAAT